MQARYMREAVEAEALADEWFNNQCLTESEAALRYTEKWHVTQQWAFDVLEWDSPTDWGEANPRVTRVRAAIVLDADNEEEAFKLAIPVERIEEWLASVKAPGRGAAGRRRVVIRLFTWVIDRQGGVAYDGEWLKIADDMSALAATARAIRWAHEYADSLIAETASREIRMTQVEIVWWTSGDSETVA